MFAETLAYAASFGMLLAFAGVRLRKQITTMVEAKHEEVDRFLRAYAYVKMIGLSSMEEELRMVNQMEEMMRTLQEQKRLEIDQLRAAQTAELQAISDNLSEHVQLYKKKMRQDLRRWVEKEIARSVSNRLLHMVGPEGFEPSTP